jgi:hypothetical protein
MLSARELPAPAKQADASAAALLRPPAGVPQRHGCAGRGRLERLTERLFKRP